MPYYKYTVIVPHYNNFDGIKTLLDSIPIRDDIKVIIIDDNSGGSELAFSKIIRERENVEVIINDINKGAGYCRNIGIDRANSKWVVFADSDDYFSDIAFDVFDKHYNSVNDIIFFGVDSINIDTKEKGERTHIINNYVSELYFNNNEDIRYSVAVPWGKMISYDLIKKHNLYFDEVMYSNDAFFSLVSGHKAKSIKADLGVVYIVTRRRDSLTTTINLNSIKVRKDITFKLNKYLHSINNKKYQSSLLKILISYRKVLSKKDLMILLFNCLCFKQKVFPKNLFILIFKRNLIDVVKKVYKNEK